MSAELILEARNEASPAMNEVIKSLDGMAKQAGITSDAGKTLARELRNQQWAEYKREVKAAAEELNGVAQKKREAAAAAEKLAAAQRQAADEARRLADAEKAATKELADNQRHYEKSRQDSIKATVDVYRMSLDVARAVVSEVQQMAKEGNVSAQELVAAVEKMKRATIEGTGGQKAANRAMSDGAKTIDSLSSATAIAVEVAKGQYKVYGLIVEQYQNLAAAAGGFRKELDMERDGIDENIAAKQRLADLRKSAAIDAEDIRQGTIEGERAAKKIHDEEIEAIRSGTIEAENAAERIAEGERRRSQESAEWQMKYLEEVEAIKKQLHDTEMVRQRQLLDMQERKTSAIKEEQKILEERQKAALGAAGQGNVESVLGSVDPRRARAQLAKQRDEAFMASGAGEEMSPAELRRERAKLRRDTFKQFNQGNVSQNELIGAQSAVVQEQLQTSGQAAKMGGVAVDAFKDAVAGLQQIKGTQEEQEAELQYFRKVLGATMSTKGRRRGDQNWGR